MRVGNERGVCLRKGALMCLCVYEKDREKKRERGERKISSDTVYSHAIEDPKRVPFKGGSFSRLGSNELKSKRDTDVMVFY